MNWPIVVAMLLCLPLMAPEASAQARSAYVSGTCTAAVDVKGVRHRSEEYGAKLPPWMADRVASLAPDYPYRERALRHTGRGYYRLRLDPKTGGVTNVAIVKSAGVSALDQCAVAALRQWRWRPGRWKAIETPVTFVLSYKEPKLAPDAVALPLHR